MSIIDAELARLRIDIPADQTSYIKRVIHTTADFDYARNLRFTPGCLETVMPELVSGTLIVTDTNMARSGISRAACDRLGIETRCYMADEDVARAASEAGTTRAVASMRKASVHDHTIFAVGNAPTALLELARLMDEGYRPALIIGVPVGFVNVVESKEAAWEAGVRHGVPGSSACGR